jgi:hypothetical protein
LKFLSFGAASSCRNFKFKNRTRIIKLLVPLLIPKFASEVLRVLANFGIGALAGPNATLNLGHDTLHGAAAGQK